MKKFAIGIIMLIFSTNTFAWWTYLENRGVPVYSYFLGDNLSFIFKFAVNEDTTPMTVTYGIGKSTDGTGWTWYTAEWDRLDVNNRYWKSKSGDLQFTETGNYYYSGKFVWTDGGYTEYASDDWAENRTTLTAGSYFTVSALPDHSSISTTAESNGDIVFNWTRENSKWALIVRSTDGDFAAPTNGQSYSASDPIDDDVVVYKGDGTPGTGEARSFTDTGLSAGTTYYYKIYAENNSYYSSGSVANLSGDQSLPVTLSSFTGQAVNGTAVLNWETASEIENAGFIIRRQEAGGSDQAAVIASYVNDAQLRGAGTTTEACSYSFTDRAVQPGAVYTYSLSDVDFGGNETAHGDVTVAVESNTAVTADSYILRAAYPNPFNAAFTIPFTLNEDMAVSLKLFSAGGDEVMTILNGRLSAGDYHYAVNADVLSSGVYLLRSSMDGTVHTQKIILLK